MGEYVRPVVETIGESAEGVYAASGERCRFGYTDANPGRDACQFCSASGGTTKEEGADGEKFAKDFVGCPDNMPIKE